jgi:hypothetical protein
MVHPDSAGCDFGCGATYCIFFDNTRCHVATLLKIGLMQIVRAMIEAEQVMRACCALSCHAPFVCASFDLTARAVLAGD